MSANILRRSLGASTAAIVVGMSMVNFSAEAAELTTFRVGEASPATPDGLVWMPINTMVLPIDLSPDQTDGVVLKANLVSKLEARLPARVACRSTSDAGAMHRVRSGPSG